MKTFILGISTGLFLHNHVYSSATKEAMDRAHPPQSSKSLHLCVKTCQRPSCELPLVSGIDTPDQGTKPSSFLCSSSRPLTFLRTSQEVLVLLSLVTSHEVLSLPLVSSETQGPLLRSSLAASKAHRSFHQSSHQKFHAASCSSNKRRELLPSAAVARPAS